MLSESVPPRNRSPFSGRSSPLAATGPIYLANRHRAWSRLARVTPATHLEI